MPAIAPQVDVVVIWKMPLVETARRASRLPFLGEATRRSANEALQALNRFRGHAYHAFDGPSFKLNLLDPLTSKQDLRNYATRQGVDLDELIEGAAKHFTSSQIVHRTQPFSQEELEFLFEDDQRAFDR